MYNDMLSTLRANYNIKITNSTGDIKPVWCLITTSDSMNNALTLLNKLIFITDKL